MNTPPTQTVHDPICHMDIEITASAGRSDYDGRTYYFCSPGCKKDFDADPEGSLKAEAEYDHSRPPEMMTAEQQPVSTAPADARTSRPWWRFWS
jgi:Cu+-exporting ATPase